MSITNIHQAKSQLSKLVEQAERGEEVIIARAGKPVVKLVPYGPILNGPRKGGQLKGQIRIADDFDTLPEELAAAFGMSGKK